jgi:hypothetical protein
MLKIRRNYQKSEKELHNAKEEEVTRCETTGPG